MVWTRKGNTKEQIATENLRMGTRGNKKEGKSQRKRDEWMKYDGVV
jgi:hypothetical protein